MLHFKHKNYTRVQNGSAKVHKRMVTLKDVAKQSGYSLRTVKKVFSEDDSGVRMETKEHILKIAKKMGYRKNMIASALATTKVHNIAIVMGDFRHFFPKAKEGFLRFYNDIRNLKFEIEFYTPEDRSLGACNKLLQEILENEQIEAVIMHASSMNGLNKQINALIAAGKPVFTFGADAPASDRICYIGPKAYEAGRIAAQIMSNYIGHKGKVFIINQIMEEMQTAERNHGFMDYIIENCPEILVQQVVVQKKEKSYYDTVREILENQEVVGILGADADCYIIGDVLKDMQDTKTVAMGFDLTDDTERLLKENYFKIVLNQNPEKQAYKAFQAISNYILNGAPIERNIYTDISIITSECLRYLEE